MTTYLELVEQDNLRMYAAIQRVRELHKPDKLSFSADYVCLECQAGDDLVFYPCPTIKALDGKQ